MSTKKEQENPLHNILINVLIPVFALSFMSKDGDKIWHIGAAKAMCVALIPPLAYGIWFFVKTKKTNFFSLLGLISVALTGGLTIYLWNEDGTVKPNAGLLFGIKEACIPFVLGFAVLFSHRTSSPLLNAFLYNDSIFNIPLIEQTVAEKSAQVAYDKLLWRSTLLFACSFAISTVLNLFLALHFLGGLDHTAAGDLQRTGGEDHRLGIFGHRPAAVDFPRVHALASASRPTHHHRSRSGENSAAALRDHGYESMDRIAVFVSRNGTGARGDGQAECDSDLSG
jgi:hypothetical protein